MVLINGERVEKKAQSFLARKPESESSRCSRIKLKSFDQDGVLEDYDQQWFQVPPDWPCWCQLPLELGDHRSHCHHHEKLCQIRRAPTSLAGPSSWWTDWTQEADLQVLISSIITSKSSSSILHDVASLIIHICLRLDKVYIDRTWWWFLSLELM